MLHSIKSQAFEPLGQPMTQAVQACVHCGFCLAVCPTYGELEQEMDSPRGRIVLMKLVLEGALPWNAAQRHVDRCLGCLACEPACPSGVQYRDLLSPFRALASPNFTRTAAEKLRRWLAAQTIPFPSRFRFALRAAGLARALRPLLPRSMHPMLDLAPASVSSPQTWPALAPARGLRRARVLWRPGLARRRSLRSPGLRPAQPRRVSARRGRHRYQCRRLRFHHAGIPPRPPRHC